MLQTNRGVLVATMLKYNRGVYAALIVWLATVLSGCSRSMVNMEQGIGNNPDAARFLTVSQLQQSILYPTVYGGYRAFGAQAWYNYFGVDVGSAPALPGDIVSILNEEAPFMLDSEAGPQCVGDNHLLTLIPSHVTLPDGRRVPFTLNQLGALVRGRYFPNNVEGYRYYDPAVRTQFGAVSSKSSYWLLMTHDVLQNTRAKTYAEQQEEIKKYSSKGYVLPSGLEVATSILAYYAQSGKREGCLFGDTPWTYTCCTPDQLVDGEEPITVGGFGPTGLVVGDDCYGSDVSLYYGVACCRRFY
ncbi:MAG: hypothetical protein ACX93T_04435 [Bacteroidota bacterium]